MESIPASRSNETKRYVSGGEPAFNLKSKWLVPGSKTDGGLGKSQTVTSFYKFLIADFLFLY